MKYLLIAFFLFVSVQGTAQKRNENLAMLWSINSYRKTQNMPILSYRLSAQADVDKRAEEIQKNFTIPEEGFPDFCDGEFIFRNDTYIGLLTLMTDTSEGYFDADLHYACISIVKSDMYYAVVRVWKR